MNQRPRPAREAVPPPRWHRLQTESFVEGPQFHGPMVLPAAHGLRGDRVLPPRRNGRPTAFGHGRVLVVKLREAAVAPPSFHGASGLASPDQGPVAEDWSGLQVGAPKGAGSEVAVERGDHRGSGGVS